MSELKFENLDIGSGKIANDGEQSKEETDKKRAEEMLGKFKEEMEKIIREKERLYELYEKDPKKYKEVMDQKRKRKEREKREERSKTSNKKILKIWEEAERMGIDLNDEKVLIEFGNSVLMDLNDLFLKKYDIGVSQEDLPIVIPFDTDTPFYGKSKKEDGTEVPVIGIGDANDFLNGNYLSEELAHFYRIKFKPQEQKIEFLTEEFFGFLGRRMFQKAVIEEGGSLIDIYNEEGMDTTSKKISIDQIKKIKNYIRELKIKIKKSVDEAEKIIMRKELEGLETMREDITKHHRGYEFAIRFDLNRITNWKKLFSLSNQEVRRRFFTSNPDYSGL